MPNSLGPSGLQVQSYQELVDNYTTQYRLFYGPDINLSSDSPDGQMMMINIQSVIDLQDLLVQIYNQFDPDNAIGKVLDQRVALNGIQRQAGTFTTTNVTITVTQPLNLYGLDQAIQDAYTVSDNAGNKWQLLTTQNISAAGTYVFLFKSAVAGAVYSVPNTITVPVTIVLGVSAINNPTTFTTLGINEESDNALKIRRQKSVALSSQGFHDALLAALENITGVSSAFVYENLSGSTNSDGVPGHSLWVIVSGTAAAADIANAIYTKRNAGCGMYGDVSYIITQKDLSPFIVSWDVVTPQNLFIKFTATSLDGINAPAIASIVTGLPSIEVPGVHAQVNINDLATQVQKIDPNTLVTNAGFSLSAAGPYYPSLVPTSKKNQFAVSAANIIALPMILSPAIYSIGRGGLTKTFVAQGGYGPNTFDISSGIGAVDATTGVYTSPAGAGSAIVRVTDSLGNTATSMVTIT